MTSLNLEIATSPDDRNAVCRRNLRRIAAGQPATGPNRSNRSADDVWGRSSLGTAPTDAPPRYRRADPNATHYDVALASRGRNTHRPAHETRASEFDEKGGAK
jgi:hypothetical protein